MTICACFDMYHNISYMIFYASVIQQGIDVYSFHPDQIQHMVLEPVPGVGAPQHRPPVPIMFVNGNHFMAMLGSELFRSMR